MEIVRKFLTGDEIQPPNIRYNADCDCVQISPDGGTTWNDSPGSDPRSAPAYQLPARTTTDPKCDAAANMIAYMQSLINADIQYADQVSLATAIVGIIYFIFPPAAIFEAILIAVGLILAVGSVAIDDAFTPETWDILLCLIYAQLDADGQFDETTLNAFLDSVSDMFPGTVASVISAHSTTMGVVGWNNAGAKGDVVGDCVTCSTWCRSYDFTVDPQGFELLLSQPRGEWVDGVGWTAIDFSDSGFNFRLLQITRDFTGIEITHANLHYTFENGGGGNVEMSIGSTPEVIFSDSTDYPAGHDGGGDVTEEGVLGIFGVPYAGTGTPGGSFTATSLDLRGTGTPPDDGVDCS